MFSYYANFLCVRHTHVWVWRKLPFLLFYGCDTSVERGLYGVITFYWLINVHNLLLQCPISEIKLLSQLFFYKGLELVLAIQITPYTLFILVI